jgi:hypothetical protein
VHGAALEQSISDTESPFPRRSPFATITVRRLQPVGDARVPAMFVGVGVVNAPTTPRPYCCPTLLVLRILFTTAEA